MQPPRTRCAECGHVGDAGEYHPYLFCVLVKAGIRAPGAFLEAHGWFRREPA